jgi:hypothetical protein
MPFGAVQPGGASGRDGNIVLFFLVLVLLLLVRDDVVGAGQQ